METKIIFSDIEPAILKEMLETAKVATAPHLSRWTDRLSERVARFCGSWTFIMVFIAMVSGWAIWNTLIALKAFDPYPYVFLNLCLTVIMSLQGPLILMSQARQNKQNRRESVALYTLSLKAEAEGTQRGLELSRIEEKLEEILSHLASRP